MLSNLRILSASFMGSTKKFIATGDANLRARESVERESRPVKVEKSNNLHKVA